MLLFDRLAKKAPGQSGAFFITFSIAAAALMSGDVAQDPFGSLSRNDFAGQAPAVVHEAAPRAACRCAGRKMGKCWAFARGLTYACCARTDVFDALTHAHPDFCRYSRLRLFLLP